MFQGWVRYGCGSWRRVAGMEYATWDECWRWLMAFQVTSEEIERWVGEAGLPPVGTHERTR